MITISNLIFWLLPWNFLSIPLYKIIFHHVLKSHDGSNTFPSYPSMNSWNVPGQSDARDAISNLAKTNIIFVLATRFWGDARIPARLVWRQLSINNRVYGIPTCEIYCLGLQDLVTLLRMIPWFSNDAHVPARLVWWQLSINKRVYEIPTCVCVKFLNLSDCPTVC